MLNSQITNLNTLQCTSSRGNLVVKRVDNSLTAAPTMKPKHLKLSYLDTEATSQPDQVCPELKQLKKMQTCEAQLVQYSC
jgi:hypothetical protein